MVYFEAPLNSFQIFRKRVASCALAIATLVIACAAWAADDGKVDELMRKSGLWEQVGGLREQLRSGASQAREEAKASEGRRHGTTDADFARLLGAIDQAIAPRRMRRLVASELGRELAAPDIDAALEWLSSDLGRRLTRLEEKASSSDSSNIGKEAGHIIAALPKPRVAVIERLMTALDLDARTVDSAVNMSAAIVYGLTAMSPEADPDEAANGVRKRLGAQRAPMMAYFHRMSLASLARTYEGVSDEDLARYVRFNETPAARRYNAAASRALEAAIVQGSFDIGRRLGRNVPRRTLRS
jgi:hypothetical protein